MNLPPPQPGLEPGDLTAFVDEVTACLVRGERYQSPGFGTFSTCSRKAAPGRPACRMATFRASTELREQVANHTALPVPGAHAAAVRALVEAMQRDGGVQVPGLGHLDVARATGKKPRLTFRATAGLNARLTQG